LKTKGGVSAVFRVADRRPWRALVVALVAFFVAGTGAALAAWKQPVAGSLNVDASDGVGEPSIANIGGVPYVAWTEDNGSGTLQIRVAALSPAGWSAVGGSLNVDPSHGAGSPSIAGFGAVGNEQPWVAWAESDGSHDQVRVAQYHLGSWTAVGGSLNVDPSKNAANPSIANVGGVPYVAWSELNGTNYLIRVKRYTGGAWSAVDGSLNVDASHSANYPSIANVGGVPYVTWQEDNSTSVSVPQIRVARLSGSAWSAVGGSLNVDPSKNAANPSIANVGGAPYVAWSENNGTTDQLRVAVRGTNSWSAVGGSLNVDASQPAASARIANVGGVPYVAWVEPSSPNFNFLILVKRFTGTTWSAVGAPLNVDASQSAVNPSIANVGGVPYVASAETTGPPPPQLEIRAVRLEPDFLSQRAVPSKTGATLTTRARTYGIPYPIGFDYGTALEHETTTDSAAAGAGAVTVTRTVSGLHPGTRYKFRPFAIAGLPLPLAFGPLGAFSPDATPPALRSARVVPARFAVDPNGAAEAPVPFAAKHKKKVPRGTRFSYSLSEPARVVFTLERKSSGRRVAGKCVKATKSNKGKPKCTRLTRVGRFAKQSVAGKNVKRFSGKIGKRTLNIGRYRATLVATDPAGNRSLAKQLSFTVAKP
jgi:hypothetical protein